jgi:hypothetical protein
MSIGMKEARRLREKWGDKLSGLSVPGDGGGHPARWRSVSHWPPDSLTAPDSDAQRGRTHAAAVCPAL